MKAKTKLTRLCSILLTLVMVAGMLSTTALAEGAAPATATADFTVDADAALALLNTAKTGTEDSTWDSDTKTLTLNGVNFETTAVDAVKLPGGTTIVLNGVNTITGGPAVTEVNGGWCCGIRVEGNLTISGTGSLTVIGGDASETSGVSAGIFSHVNDRNQGSTVRITSGTVEAMGGLAREHSYGILAGWTGYGDVVISGTANITAKGGDMVQDNISYGIYAKTKSNNANGGYVTISDDAHVTAIGGDNALWGNGITSRSVTISGNARVRAESGKSGDNIGICASDRVTISGNAQVTAIGKDGHYSAGISGVAAHTREVNISDNAQVTATGGNAGDQSYGIYVYNLNISGGTVIAKAGVVTYAPGHYWTPSSGNAGIYSSNEVNITGGVVTAMAAPVYGKDGKLDNTDSRGSINRPINISDGIVTAAGYPNDCSATFQNDGGYKNSFQANGGIGHMSFTKGTAGEYAGYTLPANGFIAPVGMQFKAWEVGNVQKNVGDTITIGETTAVKALWEYIDYNVGVTNGTASAGGNTITTANINTEVTLTAAAIPGKVFDHWVVDGESTSITLADANSATTTFTMPAGDVSVKAVYLDAISTLAITDITAPVSNTALDTTASCATTGIINTTPTVTWTPDHSQAGYSTIYTASVTLTADVGYTFADGVAATVNGNTANVTKNANGTLTVTYTFPETAAEVLISEVAITGIDAPVSNTTLDTAAVCETTGVSTTAPTVAWDIGGFEFKAEYGTAYTAYVTLTASEGYTFTDGVTATVNGNSATSVAKEADGTLTVTYTFPKTEKHNIEIAVDTDVRDAEAATNPTINSGYKFEFCFFIEDTDKDGVFVNDTGTSLVWDDKTFVVDKTLVEAFAAQSGGRFTYESIMAALKDEFDLDELKTEFTAGYDYSVLAYIAHSDGAEFAYNNTTDRLATNAIVKINGTDKTADCLTYTDYIVIMPGTCVFTASSATTYTITFDANGGSVTPASAVTDTDGKLTSLPTPTRNRYTFNGWYTEASGGTKVETDYVFNANTTIYAHWTYTGGGGGGTVATNTVTVDSVKNGDVAISPKYAAKGTIVTLKIEPDKGYKLDTVTVTDKNGNKIKLTDKGNGEYTFTMPATKVNIETTFVEETTTEDNTMLNFFVDIPYDSYYYDAVLWAAENGITGGMDDTHFAPDITCTRVQAITFLWRAAGSPMPKSSEISFEDVEIDSYYYYAVLWALENGITSGTSATTFSPDDTCSRGQIVTFLWRSVKSPTVGMDNTFTDVSFDSYYTDATNWAVANGITSGTSDTTFSPDETCTRGQIVTFLYRFFVK